ncbi:electron transfer flavoprotein subunit alpha/FixB family protein [Proteiniclasticum sp. BAD-10]|uniref:Electron transfer flavoprotein subunit alpha/FixB family protein n=1 Tax=Proteiniclasticum sediminis TaxID=2804028 RepID=A0A941CRJ0_9CLOT|nr:electron transfer flavoprotein subunit alpha/FixB family protein [Proteiniclasticum sediminis]MBR0577387.1 electron transfer flavoprotein subunit alpha/FixB family protein [Proteiniclasticum sediminis]
MSRKRVLIFVDPENFRNSIDLIEVANKIFEGKDIELFGLSSEQQMKKSMGYFDVLIEDVTKGMESYDTMCVTDYVEGLHRKVGFDAILVPATFFGRMVAPRIARRLHTGLVADVTDLKVEGDSIEMIRPAFSGKIMAGIINIGTGPMMMTVRQNVFHFEDLPMKNTKVLIFEHPLSASKKIRILETEEKGVSYDIRDSEVLISGGGGAKHVFKQLHELSDLLHGNVSASRKIIDQGLAPRAIQVGQSGKTVTPKLYIALGIDGAIQHVEGLKNVKHIIAVNLNKNAPICSLSDLVVVGDTSQFVEKLIQRLNKH